MSFPEQLTQALSIPAASLAPANTASNNTTPATVGPADMSKYRRVIARVVAGAFTASTNTLVQFQASANSGNSFTNIANGPTLLFANTGTTAQEGTLEIRADQMPANTRYLQLALLTSGGANTGAFLSASLYGGEAPYKPSSQWDVANVVNTYSLTRVVASI